MNPQHATLVSRETSQPTELVCIDFLSRMENMLVMTDKFTKYAQAYPTHSQMVRKANKTLFEKFLYIKTSTSVCTVIRDAILKISSLKLCVHCQALKIAVLPHVTVCGMG